MLFLLLQLILNSIADWRTYIFHPWSLFVLVFLIQRQIFLNTSRISMIIISLEASSCFTVLSPIAINILNRLFPDFGIQHCQRLIHLCYFLLPTLVSAIVSFFLPLHFFSTGLPHFEIYWGTSYLLALWQWFEVVGGIDHEVPIVFDNVLSSLLAFIINFNLFVKCTPASRQILLLALSHHHIQYSFCRVLNCRLPLTHYLDFWLWGFQLSLCFWQRWFSLFLLFVNLNVLLHLRSQIFQFIFVPEHSSWFFHWIFLIFFVTSHWHLPFLHFLQNLYLFYFDQLVQLFDALLVFNYNIVVPFLVCWHNFSCSF